MVRIMYATLKKVEDRSEQEGIIDRTLLSKFNRWPHVFNLANCIVGASVLAMPYCLQQVLRSVSVHVFEYLFRSYVKGSVATV